MTCHASRIVLVIAIRKEPRHENVTSNHARSSSADHRHRNGGADFQHRRRGQWQTLQIVRSGRLRTEGDKTGAGIATWTVSCVRHASGSLLSRDSLAQVLQLSSSAMRRLLRNWMNDDSWGIGVLEPLLLLSCIALIGALLGLL